DVVFVAAPMGHVHQEEVEAVWVGSGIQEGRPVAQTGRGDLALAEEREHGAADDLHRAWRVLALEGHGDCLAYVTSSAGQALAAEDDLVGSPRCTALQQRGKQRWALSTSERDGGDRAAGDGCFDMVPERPTRHASLLAQERLDVG